MTENIKIVEILNGSSTTTISSTLTIQKGAAQTSFSLPDSTTAALPMAITPATDVVSDDSLRFILIPLGVFLIIIILSALVFLMARNRRRLAHIYCKRRMHRRSISRQIFDDDSDEALEQGENYAHDENDPTECLLKGKLQIDNSYETYKSTTRKNAYA